MGGKLSREDGRLLDPKIPIQMRGTQYGTGPPTDDTSPGSEDVCDTDVSFAPRPARIKTDIAPRGVRFSDELVFTPSYEAYTPTPTSDLKYKSPERRQRGLLAPPSSVTRPNIEDTLRRVSIVLHKHINTCEMRLHLAHLSHGKELRRRRSRMGARSLSSDMDDDWGGWDPEEEEELMREMGRDLFQSDKIDVFREDLYVSPQYLYKFVRVPIARPGVCYSMKQVKASYHIPTPDEMYTFMLTLFRKAGLSSECAIVCLIYIERLMEVARVPLVAITWRPIVLCGLLLASKVWQDLSSWNVEFSQIFPQFNLQNINRLERVFVNHLKWDLYISSSLYAKYYFALRSLYEKRDIRRRYNMVLNVNPPKADEVSARTGAVRNDLKDIFSRSC